jgi:hypothetical protein
VALQEVSGISAVIAMAAATVRAGRLFLIMARLLEETELWWTGRRRLLGFSVVGFEEYVHGTLREVAWAFAPDRGHGCG